jgi:hypothetical protein
MAQFKIGNMFDAPLPDLLCFTANATIKANGALVIGKGAAEEVRDRFPGIDLKLGNTISCYGRNGRYGLAIISWPALDTKIAAFQVKFDYLEPANLGLIRYSTIKLFEYIVCFQPASVYLNFPDIGNDGLAEADALPIVSLLPDNVTIWKLP